MDTNQVITPTELISPNFHSDKKKSWFLLSFYLKHKPEWGKDLMKSTFCIFREIAYVNDVNELIGLGRSYLPFNYKGISIFLKCISLKSPKPLGVVLRENYGSAVKVVIISNDVILKNITPYRNELTETSCYKRILSVNNEQLTILVEEDFIK